MSDLLSPDQGIEVQPLGEFTEKAYLEYSMYVILDRALPHIGDGLKPVQRRIIYAMSELGLSAGAKYKKSARTVGDVLGKYHPHGDSACYEAMVHMAQPFSFRYPVVDGQGNWGSQDDPKSFAAMRYTEAKLMAFSKLLLQELGHGTVDWGVNFDGTLKEPRLLPARLPHVLLNGAMGIAVGMSTDIQPHNVNEVADACVLLLDQPKASLDEVMAYIQGPDFPSSAEIISSRADIKKLYQTGGGSIRMRATYELEDGQIVVNALPHQVSPAKVQEQIAAQMQAKKLPMVEDLRDESDHENPMRLIIVPRSTRIDIEALMQHLFATTDLERNYRVNMNVIGLNGKPQVKPLLVLLNEWLLFRRQTVTRRLQHELERLLERLHKLEGLLTAFLNLDEVIEIIRSEDEPKAVLVQRFALSELQADYILDTRLRQLARLEEVKIRDEQRELADRRAAIEKLLSSDRRLTTLLKKEILADKATYGDPRRSPIVSRLAATPMDQSALVPSEPVTVVLSARGWVRSAKGHDVNPETLNYKSGDAYQHASAGRSNQNAYFIDSTGRSYVLAAHTLPSARSLGEPLNGRFKGQDGARYVGCIVGSDDERVLLATTAGYGFVACLSDLHSRNKAGKAALSVSAGAEVLLPERVPLVGRCFCFVVTASGHLAGFDLADLPQMSKGKGNKMTGISGPDFNAGKDRVIGVALVTQGSQLRLTAGKRHLGLKWGDLQAYVVDRGKKGPKLPRGYQKVDQLEVLS